MDQARSAPPSRRPYALLGLMTGAAFAAVMTVPLFLLPMGGYAFLPAAALYAFSMGCGYRMGRRWKTRTEAETASAPGRACPKVLDTSAIIDGRILDICRTGFLEGDIVVPAFVLDELRHIADSADALRRGRGRRGLDVLQKLQEEVPLRIEEKDDYDGEVDVKLLRHIRGGQRLGIAAVQDIQCLRDVMVSHGLPGLVQAPEAGNLQHHLGAKQ